MKNINKLLFFLLLCITSTSFAALYIKSKSINLGKIFQGKPIDYTFYIENTNDKPVHIKKIVPD